ncbi:hypothetical protein E4U54_006175 [Claviceps lovelessii]|nr:hypothetical protein E4U54_006175 [Claviceps lovelessii]
MPVRHLHDPVHLDTPTSVKTGLYSVESAAKLCGPWRPPWNREGVGHDLFVQKPPDQIKPPRNTMPYREDLAPRVLASSAAVTAPA